MNRPPRPARRRAWPRVLVLLLVLCVPGAHAGAQAAPSVTVAAVGEGAGGAGGLAAEGDPLDTVLRGPGRGAHRPVVPRRPVRPPDPAVAHLGGGPPQPPYALRALRCVVLIC
ncbi:hypothetical protein [Streptomyces sp. NPDC057877]|uniref:hypothetical protein n=1 Tax=Streptomyces sp. NPDC057877 TaxID=3346269 RepID=UPI0036916D64